MVHINQGDVAKSNNLPPAQYQAQGTEVKERTTQAGDTQWNVVFTITDGDYKGSKVFDNFLFNGGKAENRVRAFLSAIGLYDGKSIDVEKEDILYKPLLITTINEKQPDGQVFPRCSFAGFDPISNQVVTENNTTAEQKLNDSQPIGENEVPF